VTNEQLNLYLRGLISRLQGVVFDINELEDANDRGKELAWIGEGPEPFVLLWPNQPVELDPARWEEREVGLNAAAIQLQAFIDDFTEEVAAALQS